MYNPSTRKRVSSTTKRDRSNQIITKIGDLWYSEHAIKRKLERGIRDDELICIWASPWLWKNGSYQNRTRYYEADYGIILVIDNGTGIVVTIVESEWRKEYSSRKKRYRRISHPRFIPLPIRL
jgi:hypothetical protein